MDVIAAAHKTVHKIEHGGSPALAARMGMSSTVLNSKVNPNCDTHHLRLDEALTIMEFTGDHTIIDAMANRLGGVFSKMEKTAASEESMVMSLLRIGGQSGNLLGEFKKAIEDGRIDCSEHKQLKQILQKQKSDLHALELVLDQQRGE